MIVTMMIDDVLVELRLNVLSPAKLLEVQISCQESKGLAPSGIPGGPQRSYTHLFKVAVCIPDRILSVGMFGSDGRREPI